MIVVGRIILTIQTLMNSTTSGN